MIKFSREFVRVQILYNTKGSSSTKYQSEETKGHQKRGKYFKVLARLIYMWLTL